MKKNDTKNCVTVGDSMTTVVTCDQRVALLCEKTENKTFKMLTIANAKQDQAEEDQEDEPSEVPLGESEKKGKKKKRT